jgi:hypothetical protein
MDSKQEFLDAITLGMDIESACHLAGLAPSATYRLLERGKVEQERLARASKALKPKATEAGALELWQAVTKARAVSQRAYIKAIQSASAEDWKAAKFMLEHINPNVFATGGSVREVEAENLGEIEAL